jgi:mycofactocin precursor
MGLFRSNGYGNLSSHAEVLTKMSDQEKGICAEPNKEKEKEIFSVDEIKIEELAIDGICGVY